MALSSPIKTALLLIPKTGLASLNSAYSGRLLYFRPFRIRSRNASPRKRMLLAGGGLFTSPSMLGFWIFLSIDTKPPTVWYTTRKSANLTPAWASTISISRITKNDRAAFEAAQREWASAITTAIASRINAHHPARRAALAGRGMNAPRYANRDTTCRKSRSPVCRQSCVCRASSCQRTAVASFRRPRQIFRGVRAVGSQRSLCASVQEFSEPAQPYG